MDKNGNGLSAKDLIRRTKNELIEISKMLGIGTENGKKRQGLISSIAKKLKEHKTDIEKRLPAEKIVDDNSTPKGVPPAGDAPKSDVPIQSRVRLAVAGMVKKTAEVAEKILLAGTGTDVGRVGSAEGKIPNPPAPPPLGGVVPPPKEGDIKIVHGTGEAEAAKFSISENPHPQTFPLDENLGKLPEGYGSGRFFITGRDPNWLFLYWDLTPSNLGEIKSKSIDGRMHLQVHDVTDIIFDGSNAHSTIEFIIPDGAKSWYAYVNAPGRHFSARLGSKTSSGFEAALVSRKIQMPQDDFSRKNEASFVTIPFDLPFAEIKQLLQDNIKEPRDLAIALAKLQAHGVKLPFEYSGIGLSDGKSVDIPGQDMEGYRRSLSGSEELLERLKKESLINISSGVSSTFSGSD